MPVAINGYKSHDKPAKSEPNFALGVDAVPVTKQRQPYIPPSDSKLEYPSVGRVNLAATHDAPEGSQEDGFAAQHAHQTVLQQHCAYWDKDNDGVIWPWDTYFGCRAWGWAFPLAVLAMVIIHGALSYLTLPGFLPDPFFRIYLNKIHKDKHGSDSGAYDTEGRFRAQNFEDVFAKYDKGNKGGLTTGDIWRMLSGQRVAVDPFGWTAAALEWYALYLLVWPEDGILRKEEARKSYDGSLFQYKADEFARKQKARSRVG